MPLEIQRDVDLAPLTTLGIGGPARYFVKAESEEALVEALRFADENSLAVFVLGGGSNVLIADSGFNGLVIHIGMKGIAVDKRGGKAYVTAQAGEDWDEFVSHCVDQNLAGVECLSGIPGTVGGTPVQNVGAYGQDVSETIVSVRCFDNERREFVTLTNVECGFSYRKSIFNSAMSGRYIVTAVTFLLTPDGEPKIAYAELEKAMRSSILARWASETLDDSQVVSTIPSRIFRSLEYVRYIVLRLRGNKSMVIDANDPNSRSAGSFFKNPLVSQNAFDEIKARYEAIPSFPAGDGMVKIPAAWLIENAGFSKGFTLGNAGISSKHTLALINRGGATAAEVIALKKAVQNAVRDTFGIELVPEPIMVGF